MIGCAGIIAGIAFAIGLIASLFARDASLGERLLIPFMAAGMTFIAALLLFWRDKARHTRLIRRVRRKLLERDDIRDSEFAKSLPDVDPVFLLQLRSAIAEFFNVPPARIHASDDLRQDYLFDKIEPGFHFFIMHHMIKAREIRYSPTKIVVFHSNNLQGIRDLAGEIQRILEDLAGGNNGDSGIRFDTPS